jgi:hypothetical protein
MSQSSTHFPISITLRNDIFCCVPVLGGEDCDIYQELGGQYSKKMENIMHIGGSQTRVRKKGSWLQWKKQKTREPHLPVYNCNMTCTFREMRPRKSEGKQNVDMHYWPLPVASWNRTYWTKRSNTAMLQQCKKTKESPTTCTWILCFWGAWLTSSLFGSCGEAFCDGTGVSFPVL